MPSKPTKVAFTVHRLRGLPSPGSGRRYVYDSKTKGLCLCLSSTGGRVLYWYGRLGGAPERIRLGKFPDLSIANARKIASRLTADQADGRDPAAERRAQRRSPTLHDLFDHWMTAHANVHKKPGPAKEDVRQYEQYLKPWASRRLATIKKVDVAGLHARVGSENGPYAANRLLSLLRAMFNKADDLGFDGANPCRGIKKFKEQPRDRFLNGDELKRFFDALNREEDLPRDFFMTLLLTGARRGNVQDMTWSQIDFASAVWRIADTKVGEPLRVPLVEPALRLLRRRYERRGDSPWVFATDSRQGRLTEPKVPWKRILERAELHDVRLHDLRRSLGSWMAGTGASLPVIGKGLGHKQQSTTAIYAQLDLQPVREAMDAATTAMLTAGGLLEGPIDTTSEEMDDGEA